MHERESMNSDAKKTQKTGIWQRALNDIKRRIITGIITIIPMTITVLILYFIIKQIHLIFLPIVSRFVYTNIPVINKIIPVLLSIFLGFSLVYILGLLSATIAMRRLIALGEKVLTHIPIIKVLYLTSKQIVDTITLPQKTAFKKVVAIEYPRKGMYGIGFLTGEMVVPQTGEILVTIFLPTTPNPTSGFLLILPAEQVYEINLSIDEGFKFIISGGILNPERFEMHPYKKISTEDRHINKGEHHEGILEKQ